MIVVSEVLLKQMEQYCQELLPEEACGVIWGIHPSGTDSIEVKKFTPIKNDSNNPSNHFTMEPTKWASILFEAEKSKLAIIGIFHSHPTSLAIPSNEDLQTQWHSLPSYWIFSYKNETKPYVKAYRLHHNQSFLEMPIQVIPNHF